ncbi:hypothetical protein AYO38_00775 [bacterium SCGC AG-212-C10]|nr:hypothetical protein AYO38_00775 [bacterium SCGC AG-212-C10]
MADETEAPPQAAIGTIAWRDLTVDDAEGVGAFYSKVLGWRMEPLDMDGYSDYMMIPEGASGAEAGVCHRRGQNADMPPQWIMYVMVADIEAAVAECLRNGGKTVTDIRAAGEDGIFCVIQDPAGAVLGLYQNK